MPVPNLTPQDMGGVTVTSPEDVGTHISAIGKRIDSIKMKKNLGYKQLEEIRKKGVADILGILRSKGINVSNPAEMQQFLQMLDQVDPDLAQGVRWALGMMLPDQHETDHMNGTGLADYLLGGAAKMPLGMPSSQPMSGGTGPSPDMGMPPETSPEAPQMENQEPAPDQEMAQ